MRKTDYFRLGVFIVSGTALLIFVIVVLGAGRFFSKTVILETYFNEAINGLEVGSPVRFRGVKIGRVSEIDFVMGRYTTMEQSDSRYVYVACELTHSEFLAGPKSSAQDDLNREIKRGLRIRPISQGLTGALNLSLDYFPPQSNPPLKIDWVPDNLYVPSAPSTMNRIEAAIADASDAISSLDSDDIEAILKSIRSVTENLSSFFAQADAKGIGEMLVRNLEQTEKIFSRLNVMLGDKSAGQLLPTAQLVLNDVHGFFATAGPDMAAAASDMRDTFASLKRTTTKLEQAMNDPKTDIAGALENVTKATASVNVAAARFQDLMNRTNGLVAGQEANIEEIVENVRLLVLNLKELTEEAKRYPSGVLFGPPPVEASPNAQ